MHKSRMAVFVLDHNVDDPAEAARFWSTALGCEVDVEASKIDPVYTVLDTPDDQPNVLLQRVDHPPRIHMDIETDDIEAEAKRLEAAGAKRVSAVKTWVVMEAPTGHRFCLVKPQRPDFDEKANVWP